MAPPANCAMVAPKARLRPRIVPWWHNSPRSAPDYCQVGSKGPDPPPITAKLAAKGAIRPRL
ncbi:MAG: hypothetical protein K6T83_07705, partial [Alicyclobacillus sp.]|nr:hypothetical protein [Alicyclobacillus sp.]